MQRPLWLCHEDRNGSRIFLHIYVQPGASTSEVQGVHDGNLKIRIAARPMEGAANKEIIRFLSKKLMIPQSLITIVAGDKSRNKIVALDSMDEAVVVMRLAPT